MPHFLIDCSDDVIVERSKVEIMSAVHQAAVDSGLFDPKDIKVRARPFDEYMVGGATEPFIHIFSHIMQGRTTEQKAMLSKKVVRVVSDMFPKVNFIAMNVDEFEKATYCNKAML
ncbi:MAG: 5-carboxymethyl-2-hydroxymuconate Delta-isomerase [Cyclobacteriaceae bacterium]